MNYVNDTHKQYEEALKRVVKKNVKPTKASTAREAERDPASIKYGRSEWMNQLINNIDKAYESWVKKNKSNESKQNKRLKDKDEKIAELEQRLNNSHTNELYLIKEIHDLKKENHDFKMEVVLFRNSKPTLADVSVNLIDYTKLD